MLGQGQTAYALDAPVAKAGMILSHPDATVIETLVCGAAALDFGVVVELVSGLAVIAQGTSDPDANVLYGITVYKDTLEGPIAGASTLPYQPGDNVAVLRKGAIAAQCVSGTTVTKGGQARVAHSSDGSHSQGLITSAAAAGTSGQEVSAWANGELVFDKTDLALASASVPLVGVQLAAP